MASITGFLFFMISVSLTALSDTAGTFVVKVTDANEVEKTVVIPRAKITIEELGVSATTNTEGICTFKNIPEGKYTLDCRMIGYCNETVRKIKVTKECTTTVNVQLWWSIYPAIPIDTDTINFGPDSLVDTTACPIEVKLFIEKDTFYLGEDIVLWSEITNSAPHPIFIVEPLIRKGYVEEHLTRSTIAVEHGEGKDVIKRRVWLVGHLSIYGTAIKLLYPKETYKPFDEKAVLNKWYEISEPGEYYISMHIKQNRRFLYKRIRQQVGIYFPNCDFYTDRLEITILPERK